MVFVVTADTKQLVMKLDDEIKSSLEIAFVIVVVVFSIVICVAMFAFVVNNQHYIEIADYLHEQTPQNESTEYIKGWNDCIDTFEDKWVLPETNVTTTQTKE